LNVDNLLNKTKKYIPLCCE